MVASSTSNYNLIEGITDVDGTPVTNFVVQDNGNLGLGTSDVEMPPAGVNIQMLNNSIHSGSASIYGISMLNNAYLGSLINHRYRLTDETGGYFIANGQHLFAVAPSGTINTNITWSYPFKINNDTTMDFTGQISLAGTATNIALGSNWISGDGGDEGVFVGATGNVGVGSSSPNSRLSITGLVRTETGFSVDTVNTNPASGNLVGTYVGGGYVSVNRTSAVSGFFGRTDDGSVMTFYSAGVAAGSISMAAGVVTYGAFTGSHYGLTGGIVYPVGTVLELTGDSDNYHNNPNSEILYGMTKSTSENNPQIIGSYLGRTEPTQTESYENPTMVMAVGNGDMWVADQGEDLKQGDYLISSNVQGHAEKDTRTHDISYVIARVSEDIQWSAVTESVNGVKHKKISVFFENFDRYNFNLADIASSTLTLANLSNQTPNERFLSGLVDKLVVWFADTSNGIGTMAADVFKSQSVETQELCIGNTCVTESQLIELLQNNNPSPTPTPSPSPTPTPDPTPVPTPDPDPVPPPVQDPIPPTHDPVPDPVPDPIPAP